MSWTSGGGITTRASWIAAQHMTLDSGTRVQIGTAPDVVECVALADAATQGAYFTFFVPYDVQTGNAITVQPYWAPGSTDAVAHTVRWSYDAKIIGNTNDVTVAGGTTAWTGISAARTASQLVLDTATSSGAGTTWSGGEVVRMSVRRVGADGADSYVGVVNLVGCRVAYVPVF